jgi:hypothetical protein
MAWDSTKSAPSAQQTTGPGAECVDECPLPDEIEGVGWLVEDE